MKKTGFYLIIAGLAIYILAFISKILQFLFLHPILGIALIAIVVGVILLLYGIYQESSASDTSE
ncbi:MAG: hypothetical protein D6762_06185 [Candidatus Neomarinimicrobiota bacterium]|nr:MAG: hypothetical protein D6762_06185 [Candidatus Neomarinimicrobiota bacterium]